MNKKTLTRITGAAGAGLVVAQAIMPALAAFTVNISGNGYNSDTDVDLEFTSETAIAQENDVKIENKVNLDANTGDNTVSKNTGGSIDVTTGSVDQHVDIDNAAGANSAVVETCNCDEDVEIIVSKNGADSEIDVDYTRETTVDLIQENDVDVENDVNLDAETGDNKVTKNTGGDLRLETGDVDQDVKISTEAGANVADLGGEGNGSELTIEVSENGADSEVDLEVDVETELAVLQENDVEVENDVDAWAETGDNKVSKNTGGSIDVMTGDVDQMAEIENAAGANTLVADACGCELDGSVLVEKNGADAEVDFDLVWEMISDFIQGGGKSETELESDVDFDGETGDNDVTKNGGDDMETGNVSQTTKVANEAGANVIGGEADADVEVNLSLLLDLLEMLLG